MCPLSNCYLKVLDRFFQGKHVVKQLLDQGVKITINSDDPPLLGGYLIDNYLAVANSFEDLDESSIKAQIFQLAKNSFAASFLDSSEKEYYFSLLDSYILTSNSP